MIDEINLTPTASLIQRSLFDREISLRSWGSAQDCKGIVILVHGLGAHSAWFEAMARQLKVRRWQALAYDQKGFGLRQNEKLKSYKEWVLELCEIFRGVKAENPTKPIYLLGNSMGALVVLSALQEIGPDGVIIASPGFEGHPDAFTMKYKLCSLFQAFINPDKEVTLPYCSEFSVRDPGVQSWLSADNNQRRAVPGSMLFELLKLARDVDRTVRSVSIPILMLTAGMEKVVNNETSRRFYERLQAPYKSRKHFEQSWHDLMFDPLLDEVADAMLAWQADLMLEAVLSG